MENENVVIGHNIAADGTTYSEEFTYGAEAKTVESFINVTAVTGTDPTLDVTPQFSIDGGPWRDGTAFTQKTAQGSEYENEATLVGTKMRFKFVVGSTADPDFTFDYGMVAKK